jgi:hypothetical protein
MNTSYMSRLCRRVLRATACLLTYLAVSLAPKDAAAQANEVEWDSEWPRFRRAEIAFTAGMGLQLAAALFIYPDPQRNWEGGILFDEPARDALRIKTRKGRETAQLVGDTMYYSLIGYTLLVDPLIVAGAVHGSGDVALQMMAMNLESFAFVGAIALSAEKLGRVRPSARGCQENPDYAADCDDEAMLNSSLMSGHTAAAFAGAGLTCAHHTNLPLYGGGAPDIAACAVALTAAGTVGTLRVMSDDHYATDVVLGAALGLFGGYGLPMLLHYGAGDDSARPAKSALPTFHAGSGATQVSAVLAPTVSRNQLGVTLVGSF